MIVRLISNAGILVQSGPVCVLIDGLHGKVPRFSKTPTQVIQQIMDFGDEFARIDYALITHAHVDHYDAKLMREMMQAHRETVLIGPEFLSGVPKERQVLVCEPKGTEDLCEMRVDYLRVPHEGEQFAHVVNYAYRISLGSESFIVLGDSAISETSQAVVTLTESSAVDAVFADFPLLTLSAGRKALQGVKASHIFGYHLPFAQDDTDGFRKSARAVSKKAQEQIGASVTMLMEPGQREVF